MKKLLCLFALLTLVVPRLALAKVEETAMKAPDQDLGETQAEPKDPNRATLYAVMPGIILHGWGNFYAGEPQYGTKLLVMEILGISLSLWGHNIIHQPNNWTPYFGGMSQQAGYWIKAGGVGLVGLSWIADVATAAEAAENWNKDHQLEFRMDSFEGTGARLTLAAHF